MGRIEPATDYALRRARPLRRRRASTSFPARVRMRARKPCLRLRRRLWGWKVRLPLVMMDEAVYGVAFGSVNTRRANKNFVARSAGKAAFDQQFSRKRRFPQGLFAVLSTGARVPILALSLGALPDFLLVPACPQTPLERSSTPVDDRCG